MYKILKAEKLSEIFSDGCACTKVASHCEPGQFVIVKMTRRGAYPLTIVIMTEKPERSRSWFRKSELLL